MSDRYMRTLAALITLCLATGCTSLLTGSQEQVRSGASSSLVDYLYPDGAIPPAAPDVMPELELPLRVGIAFVPATTRRSLSEAEKQHLLGEVATAFRDRPYVTSIETIPDQYLTSARGVFGMQQVAALYGVDVMALVSYDQLSFSGERDSALLYWTIVGTAVVKGNSNEVQTMIDTAVFDVQTADLLFRAPGVHSQQRNATLFDSARDLRHLQGDSFRAANTDMVQNLETALEGFEEAAKKGETVQVAWRDDGAGGGGALGGLWLALLALVSAARFRRTRAALRGPYGTLRPSGR